MTYARDPVAIIVRRSIEFDRVEVEMVRMVDGQLPKVPIFIHEDRPIDRGLFDHAVALRAGPEELEAMKGLGGLEESEVEAALAFLAPAVQRLASDFLGGDTSLIDEIGRLISRSPEMGREFDIRREIDLPATAEQVWEAITTRRGMAGWFGDQERIPQGSLALRVGPAAPPPDRGAGVPDSSTQAFEYVIEGHEGGRARLRFVRSGFLSQSWEGDFDFEELTGRGWDMYLHILAEYLARFQDRTGGRRHGRRPGAGGGRRPVTH